MANRQQAPQRQSQKLRRLEWLMARPDLIRDLPSDRQDVSDKQSALLKATVWEMKAAGLYSKTTEAMDVSWGIRLMIGQLR